MEVVEERDLGTVPPENFYCYFLVSKCVFWCILRSTLWLIRPTSENMYKRLIQVDLHEKLARLIYFLVHVFFSYAFLAPNRIMQPYSAKVCTRTCINGIKI